MSTAKTLTALIETFEKAEKDLQSSLHQFAGATCYYRGVPHKIQKRKTKTGEQFYLRCLMSKEAMEAIEKSGHTFAKVAVKKVVKK